MAPLTKAAVVALLGSFPRGLSQAAAKAVGEIIREMMPALSQAGANEVAQIISSGINTEYGGGSILDAIRDIAKVLDVPVQRHHLEPLRTAVESGITIDDFFKLVHRHYPLPKRRAAPRAAPRARKLNPQIYEPIRAAVRVPEIPEMTSSAREGVNSLLARFQPQPLPAGEVGGFARKRVPWAM